MSLGLLELPKHVEVYRTGSDDDTEDYSRTLWLMGLVDGGWEIMYENETS